MNNHVKYILSIALLVSVAPLLPAVVTANEAEVLYWVAPMDPNYRRDKPGKSPMGMDLIPVYAEQRRQRRRRHYHRARGRAESRGAHRQSRNARGCGAASTPSATSTTTSRW